MNVVICTTPIRPVATDYPPFAALAVIQSLRQAGYAPMFYDIDALRPDFETVVEYFAKAQPDVVGISAVVSTAYAYTKELCHAIRAVSPRTTIIVGGNLAASAELLHRFCDVDYCVIGEGERVAVNLLRYCESHGRDRDYDALRRIPGITYLQPDGEMLFTGYEVQVPAEELLDPDYSILEDSSDIARFIHDPRARYDFAQDPRTHDTHRAGKMMGTIITAKGCVARCTFCHRWDKGYRALPVDVVVRRMKYLMDRYNVGFFDLSDENFGSDRRQAEQLIEAFAGLDILYFVSGVRCRTVDPELLKRMKQSGCVAVYYGMETGSPTILNVMEKKTSLEHNLNAAVWTHEAGLYTIYQLVFGMPGETSETIRETTDFFKNVTQFLPDPPPDRLSVNYIQALPGTPVYEFARANGFIGTSLEDEEQYLIRISDINAAEDHKFINFTCHDYMTVQSWKRNFVIETTANWLRYDTRRKPASWLVTWHIVQKLALTILTRQPSPEPDDVEAQDYSRGGYFNLAQQTYLKLCAVYPRPLRFAYVWLGVLWNNYKRLSHREFGARVLELLRARLWRRSVSSPNQTLRHVMKEMTPLPLTLTEQSMRPLREGR